MHLNDSKTVLGSKRDRHENIGRYLYSFSLLHVLFQAQLGLDSGHIGLPAFRHVVTDDRLHNIPLVLETPSLESTEIWTTEIDVLNRLSIMKDTGDNQIVLQEMVDDIKTAVRKAGGGATSASKKKSTTGTMKRGGKVVNEDIGDDSEEDHHH